MNKWKRRCKALEAQRNTIVVRVAVGDFAGSEQVQVVQRGTVHKFPISIIGPGGTIAMAAVEVSVS